MRQFKGEIFERPGAENENNSEQEAAAFKPEGQKIVEIPLTTEDLNTQIAALEEKYGFNISPKLQEKQGQLNSEHRRLIRRAKKFGVDMNMPIADLEGLDHFDTITQGESLKDLRNLELVESFKYYSDEDSDVDPVIKRIVERVRRDGVTTSNEKELLSYFRDIGKNAKDSEYVLFLIDQNGRRDLVPIDKLGKHGGHGRIAESLREAYENMEGYVQIHNHSDYTHQDVVKLMSKYYGEDVQIQGEKAGSLAPSITDLHSHINHHIKGGSEIVFEDKVITSDGIWTITADKESEWYRELKKFDEHDKAIRDAARDHFKHGTEPDEKSDHRKQKKISEALDILYGLDMKRVNVLDMHDYYDVKADLFLGNTKGKDGVDRVIAAAKKGGFNLTFESYDQDN